MNETIFLYLDFLGFRELAKSPKDVHKLYKVLDSARIHTDSNFQAIVFSDTLIAFHRQDRLVESTKSTEVMFLIELVQDITHRLTGSGITFRAIIAEGNFEYSKLRNIEAYFGQVLIDTHDAESSLPGVGLYLTDRIAALDCCFSSRSCGGGMNFSFLAYDLVRAENEGQGYPMDPLVCEWEDCCVAERILFQVEYLRLLFNGLSHPSIKIRAKYASAWGMYVEKCPRLVAVLIESGFDPSSLCDIDWTESRKALATRHHFFDI
jgi:hypothetical protein